MSKKNLPAKVPHLTIEDRTLYFTHIEGQWWIALKPIVEALDLEWTNYLKSLKADPILGQLWCEHTIVAGDGKPRMMACLSERYIYGWLFRLQSRNKKVLEYQRTCYDALFEHFHGKTVAEVENADQIVRLQHRLYKVEQDLKQDARFKEWQEVKSELREAQNAPAKRTKRLIEERREQLGLFDTDEDTTA